MNIVIKKLDAKDWSEFVFTELLDGDREPTKNFNQVFNTKENNHQSKLIFMEEPHGCNRVYFLCYVDGLIVGHITYQFPPKNEIAKNLVWFSSCSIDPDYKNQGIISKLLDESFVWIKENNYFVLCSEYEDEGNRYLKNTIRRKANENQVRFIDKLRENGMWTWKFIYYEWGTENAGEPIDLEDLQSEIKYL